jgi:hypothetical protein
VIFYKEKGVVLRGIMCRGTFMVSSPTSVKIGPNTKKERFGRMGGVRGKGKGKERMG